MNCELKISHLIAANSRVNTNMSWRNCETKSSYRNKVCIGRSNSHFYMERRRKDTNIEINSPELSERRSKLRFLHIWNRKKSLVIIFSRGKKNSVCNLRVCCALLFFFVVNTSLFPSYLQTTHWTSRLESEEVCAQILLKWIRIQILNWNDWFFVSF